MRALVLGVFTACGTQDPLSGNLLSPRTFQVCVRAEPSTALVLIDEEPAKDGCAEALPNDTVVVRVVATGYQMHVETLKVDGNVTIHVKLAPS